MEKWKKEYDEIVVPDHTGELMEEAVRRAKETKKEPGDKKCTVISEVRQPCSQLC